MRAVFSIFLMWMFVVAARGDDKTETAKPKAKSSLDDELFKGLDDATTAPGLKPKRTATAQPAPTATDDKPVKPDDAKPSPPAPKLSPLDAELLKQLEGDDPNPAKKPPPKESSQPASGGAGEDSDDPFVKLTRQIRDAEDRIRRTESGEPTQELQKKIVDDLEKLIAQIEQEQQKQRSSGSKSKQPGAPEPKPGSPEQQPSNKPGTGGRESQQARDSTEGTRSSRNEKPTLGNLKSLVEKAWGTLPERQRQDVMQSNVDDFPTKYQAVIEEYFKTLLRRQE